ncbi:TRAM domain-containing protein, partial [Candidatus Woesearchaeota archaeon]|nr:TRAM domain-containing protein [Candidatus Woesearchaeota archaeon]
MYGERKFGFRGGNTPPVQVGEEIDVKIEAVGEKGDGIARKSGFVLFIPNAKEGDEVRVKITKVLSKVGFAEVIGAAQAPVEKSVPKPRSRPDSSFQPPPPPPVDNPEDTEDFGDEPEEESQESEETSKEPTEELADVPQDLVEEPEPVKDADEAELVPELEDVPKPVAEESKETSEDVAELV